MLLARAALCGAGAGAVVGAEPPAGRTSSPRTVKSSARALSAPAASRRDTVGEETAPVAGGAADATMNRIFDALPAAAEAAAAAKA